MTMSRLIRELFSITFFISIATSQDVDYMDVSLEQGLVRGFLSEDQQRYNFLGIPYATTPTGELRFKAPLPPTSWAGIRNATDIMMCPQIDSYGVHHGTEDCLAVNVFVPVSIEGDAPLPVLAYIHGGSFLAGLGDVELNNRLMRQDMIVVTFNYRLGALGFLCLGTEDAPGNAGLKDQVAALRWVQENIASFGGDTHDVTVYGTSAGSVSLELLVLSEASAGLFNKVVLESGSATNSWAVAYDPIDTAKLVAGFLGLTSVENLVDLVDIYRAATPEELNLATSQYDGVVGFCPCIETVADNSTILSNSPVKTIHSGNYNPVPMMVIYTDMEGIFLLPLWYSGDNQSYYENFSELLGLDLTFNDDQEKNEVGETIKQFYMEYSESDIQGYVDYMTDSSFFYKIVNSSVGHAGNSVPVYLMEFSYHDEYSVLPGASHAEFYEFAFNKNVTGAARELVASRLTEFIYNFVKYGEPVPSPSELLPVSWPPVSAADMNYMSFGEELAARQAPLPERYALWHNIYDKYYKELPTPAPGDSVGGSGAALLSTSTLIALTGIISLLFL